jgi:hypothetical protein
LFLLDIEEHTELGAKQLLTKVVTTYLLMHTSGEFIELKGYGHGKDFADKGAGKATTYALKYCLLYTFLTPKGDIDDTDTTHSNAYKSTQKEQPQAYEIKELDKGPSKPGKVDKFTTTKEGQLLK